MFMFHYLAHRACLSEHQLGSGILTPKVQMTHIHFIC